MQIIMNMIMICIFFVPGQMERENSCSFFYPGCKYNDHPAELSCKKQIPAPPYSTRQDFHQ
jgi:hypothetical protein